MSFLDSLFEGIAEGLLSANTSGDLGCDWRCDNCDAYMNNQPGFSAIGGTWICAECGFPNDVTQNNIRHYGERPVTAPQLGYIDKIEELLGVKFYGNTLEEASDFIDDHKERYQAKLHTPYKYR
jgi:hypothetical protein